MMRNYSHRWGGHIIWYLDTGPTYSVVLRWVGGGRYGRCYSRRHRECFHIVAADFKPTNNTMQHGLGSSKFLHMAERMNSVSWKSDGEGRMTYPNVVIRSAIDL
jgi:hypothetical protein